MDIISCTGANLEEDIMNLVAHSHYKRIPNYRGLTPEQEWDLLQHHLNRVTDTCIPEEEAFRRLQAHLFKVWKDAEDKGERLFLGSRGSPDQQAVQSSLNLLNLIG